MLTETLYVRADRVCVGDTVVLAPVFGTARSAYVTKVELVGDDVNLFMFEQEVLSTSQGNVLEVRREVMPTNPDRYMP